MMDLDRETAASSEYFFMGVFDGVQSVLTEHGLDLLVLPRPTKANSLDFLRRYVTRGVFDGMILAATQRIDPRIELLESTGIPFVTLGRSTLGQELSLDRPRFRGGRSCRGRSTRRRRTQANRGDDTDRRHQFRPPVRGGLSGGAGAATALPSIPLSSSRRGATRMPATPGRSRWRPARTRPRRFC